jgi:hypothetical protein
VTPILAIDPGTERSAFVLLHEGRIVRHGLQENAWLLGFLESYQSKIPHPLLAVEMIASYGMPVGREVFETCVWIGRFVQAWQPLPVEYVYRREVKIHLCGSPKAKDANIRQALLDLYGAQGTKKAPGPTHGLRADEWAALGVAETMRDRLARKAA